MQVSQPYQFPELLNNKRCPMGNKASYYFCQSGVALGLNPCPFVCASRQCLCRAPSFPIHLHSSQNHLPPSVRGRVFSKTTRLFSLTDLCRKTNQQVQSIDIEYHDFQYQRLVRTLDAMAAAVEFRRDELKHRMQMKDASLYLDKKDTEMYEALRNDGDQCYAYFRSAGLKADKKECDARNENLRAKVDEFVKNKDFFEEIFKKAVNNPCDQIKKVLAGQQLARRDEDVEQSEQSVDTEYEALKLRQQQLFQYELLLANYPRELPSNYSPKHVFGFSDITALQLSSSRSNGPDFLHNLALPQLRSLQLQITENNVSQISDSCNLFQNLRALHLIVNPTKGKSLVQQFQKLFESGSCQGVEELRLEWRDPRKSKMARLLNIFKGVKELAVSAFLDEKALRSLLVSLELEVLVIEPGAQRSSSNIRRMDKSSEEEWPEDDVEDQHLELHNATTKQTKNIELPHIRVVHMEMANMFNDAFERIFPHFTRVQELNLSFRRDIDESKLRLICERLKNLRRLKMEDCHLENSTVSLISEGSYRLEVLSVANNLIGDAGFQAVVKHQPFLQILDIGSQQASLRQKQEPISVESLKNLHRRLPQLRRLSVKLNGYANLNFLRDLLRIKSIDLWCVDQYNVGQNDKLNFLVGGSMARPTTAAYRTCVVETADCAKLIMFKLVNNNGCGPGLRQKVRNDTISRNLQKNKHSRNLEVLMDIKRINRTEDEFYKSSTGSTN